MTRKLLFCFLTMMFLLGLNSVSAVTLTGLKAMQEKYGPVPCAIIEAPALDDIVPESNFNFSCTPRYGYHRANPIKVCFSHQRVIVGAVEMYNMDNPVMITSLTEDDYLSTSGRLIAGKYLRAPLLPTEEKCHLLSYGDLTTDGIIYCKYHGSIDRIEPETDVDKAKFFFGLKRSIPESPGRKLTENLAVIFMMCAFLAVSIGIFTFISKVKKARK